MGAFYDIASLITDISKAYKNGELDGKVSERFKKQGKQYSSIAKRASEGTLQFPVLISNSIDIETAQNICKALERNYSTFAQIAFTNAPTDVWNDTWTADDYIKKFHQNTGVRTDHHDLRDVMNFSIEKNSYIYETDDFIVYGAIYESATNTIQANNRKQLFDVMEHLRHDILNNKYIPKTEVIYNFNNKDLNKKYNSFNMREANTSLLEANDSKLSPLYGKDPILTDNDVKKSNELVATTLHIKVRLANEKGDNMGVVEFVVGIKCIMHPIKSEDMIINMVNACRNDDKVFKFLRWTTGEISFVKDLLLNMSEIKTDVSRHKSGSSPWWLTLKRRQSLAKTRDNLIIGKRILPNSTIVMSAEEVEFIKSEYGFDLYNPIFFNKIISSYFLLGFVIVDSSAQLAHFLFENQDDFQTTTFSALEKSSVNDERKFKEMLKTMNRL